MKTLKYNIGTMKTTLIMASIFGLLIHIPASANSISTGTASRFTTCVTCAKSSSPAQIGELPGDVLLLAPALPVEATFSDEAPYRETSLAPATPAEASFDDEPELMSPVAPGLLAPITPPEADFND